MKPLSVLLADDHEVVRHGLRALLMAQEDCVVVGEAADGLEAVALATKLQPCVLVLDLMMPGLNGLDVIRDVRKRAPGTRILVLSMHNSEAYVMEALRNGAIGYALKDTSGAELVNAVREVAAGRRHLSAPLSERAIEAYVSQAHTTSLDPYETLTTREREILHLVAEGLTSPDVASRLGISPRTAETHRANLMRKLDLRSQGDLIRYALRRGLITMER